MEPFDPTSTKLRPLAEYSDRLPSSRRGRMIHRATLWRWALKGTGGGILLPTVRLGGCRYTCDANVAQFMRQLSVPGPRPTAPNAMRPEERQRIAERFDLPATTPERGCA
jgi:hypothetical protein